MFNLEYNLKIMLNPILKFFLRTSDRDFIGINEIKREYPIIISITSKEDNFNNLELTLYSLLHQQIKPDRIILWLSDEYNLSGLPYNITKFIKYGLEIKFVKDLDLYTDTIYPLEQFPNAINVIADNSICYPKNWLMTLYHSYIANHKDIQVHTAHRIKLKSDLKKITSYAKWEKSINEESALYSNFAGTTGGILYPPKCFLKEVFRDDIFLKKNITNPNIWYWFMSVLSGRKIRIVKNHINKFSTTNIFKYFTTKTARKYRNYDKQILILMEYYRQNIIPKLTKEIEELADKKNN